MKTPKIMDQIRAKIRSTKGATVSFVVSSISQEYTMYGLRMKFICGRGHHV